MGKLIDLSGMIFNRLTVIKRYEDRVLPSGQKVRMWLCECSCGKKDIVVSGNHLKSGDTQSCGCYMKDRVKETHVVNLSGMVFGKLLVIEIAKETSGKRRRIKYNCLCECGKECCVLGESLVGGHTKSCGCLKNKSRVIDIVGEKFGKLTVLKLSHIKGSSYWNCQCECGNQSVVFIGNLKSGKTISCGCGSRESNLASKLKKFFVKKYFAISEYRILRNPKTNYFLPYDIFIESKNTKVGKDIFIEIHGEQHYQITGFEYMTAERKGITPEEVLLERIKLDKLKKNFSKKRGIYIEVDIRISKNEEYWIDKIEKMI